MHAGCEVGHTFPVKIIMRAAHRGHPSCNKSNNYGKRACHAFRLAPLTPSVAQFACFDMSLNLQRCPTHTHTPIHTGRHRHAVIHKQQSNRNCPPVPTPPCPHLSHWQKRPLLGSPIQLPSICMCMCVCCGEGQEEEGE